MLPHGTRELNGADNYLVLLGIFLTRHVSFYPFTLQVQNLNNIMAFPLENVLKSELRDSRLVSKDFITNSSNFSKLVVGASTERPFLLLI